MIFLSLIGTYILKLLLISKKVQAFDRRLSNKNFKIYRIKFQIQMTFFFIILFHVFEHSGKRIRLNNVLFNQFLKI